MPCQWLTLVLPISEALWVFKLLSEKKSNKNFYFCYKQVAIKGYITIILAICLDWNYKCYKIQHIPCYTSNL